MIVHVFQVHLHTILCSRESVSPGVEAGVPFDTKRGRWLRFNDTIVDEFVLNDSTLEAECFGGSYKTKADGTIYQCLPVLVIQCTSYLRFSASGSVLCSLYVVSLAAALEFGEKGSLGTVALFRGPLEC